MGVVVAPAFPTNTTRREVIHPRLYTLITQIVVGAKGIDLIWCNLTEISDEFCHFIDITPELIA